MTYLNLIFLQMNNSQHKMDDWRGGYVKGGIIFLVADTGFNWNPDLVSRSKSSESSASSKNESSLEV